MPRTKPPDPRSDMRAEIYRIMGALNVNQKELAAMTGITERTLNNRIGKKGDIGSMRLYEWWAIQDAARKRGVL